jgi:hypothetical protein
MKKCVCHAVEKEEPSFWDNDDRIENMDAVIVNVRDDSTSYCD